MKARYSVFVALVAALVGYLFYTPVPAGLVDPLHYRLFSAGFKTASLAASLRSLLQSSDDVYYPTIRVLTDLFLPAADAEVEGSNVEARYAEFDGVRVLVYDPLTKARELIPGLVYYHGGGYAIGSTRSHGELTRYLAGKLDMVVVSVEYRLAPAHPFPAGFEDCLKATRWFLDHAVEFGVDPDRVVLSGDSAGGHLTSTISMNLHDDASRPDIKLQVLFYPWIQIFDLNTPSYQTYEANFGDTGVVSKSGVARLLSALILGRIDRHFMAQVVTNAHVSEEFRQSAQYKKVLDRDVVHRKLKTTSTGSSVEGATKSNATLWDEIKDRLLDPRLAPLFRKDFTGLPAAFIATCDLDSIRDDGIFYASLLEEAGVPVTWKNYAGAFHSIVAAGPVKNIPTGVDMANDAIEFIRDNI